MQFQQAGYLRPGGKSLFIPGNRLAQLPILQADDKNDIINIAVKNNFDFIMVPNVTSVKDVQEIRLARTDAG